MSSQVLPVETVESERSVPVRRNSTRALYGNVFLPPKTNPLQAESYTVTPQRLRSQSLKDQYNDVKSYTIRPT